MGSAIFPALPGKIAAVLGAPPPIVPATKNWIDEDQALDIVRESTPVLRIVASWNRSEDWHSVGGTTRRLLEHKRRGISDQERLQQREQFDAVIYYFNKVVEDYPMSEKGTKYSKEIFVWALRKIGMEGRDN